MQDAKITTEAGHVWWRCPNCDQKLAEIIGERAVIRIGGARISFAVKTDPDQTCVKCGQPSTFRPSQNAA